MRHVFCPIIMGGSITNKIEQIVTFDEPGTHQWIVPDNVESVDVFLVGGGGGGTLISAGGGGYTKTFRGAGYTLPAEGTWKVLLDGGHDGDAIAVTPGENIQIIVGVGGAYSTGNNHASNGGYSQFKSSSYRADGGIGGYRVSGTNLHSGDGGSGGSGLAPAEYGGADGADGSDKIGTKANGKGQGHTTRDFGELTGKRNSGGGGCGNNGIGGESDYEEGKGENGTGTYMGLGGGGFGGGGGGCYTASVRGGNGGNGVVKIRYFVKPVTKYDPLLNNFVNKIGISAFTESELIATNSFIKSLRENESLFSKMVYIHPFLGSTIESKSFNLMDTSKCKIAFSTQIESAEKGIILNNGTGVIDVTGLTLNSLDSSLGLYVQNEASTDNISDIGQIPHSATRHLLMLKHNAAIGTSFFAGNSNSGNNLTNTGIIPTKLVVANVKGGTISLWRDGKMHASKTGGVSYIIPSLVYNSQSVNDNRIYSFGFLGTGLTEEEISALTIIVNNYMIALERNI